MCYLGMLRIFIGDLEAVAYELRIVVFNVNG